jgi:competence protein ComEC
MKGLREHKQIVLGVAALLLGVWVAAKGVTVISLLWAGLVLVWRKYWLVLGVLFCVGILRYEMVLPEIGEEEFGWRELEGVISDYPDVREDRIKLTIEGEDLPGRVLVTVHRYPEFAYGERVLIKGEMQVPTEFEDFSYKKYLRRYGVFGVMYYPRVEVIGAPRQDDWRFWVFGLKSIFETRLNRLFTEPHASFAAGLLLGSRRGIPEELMEDFNISGLTHIIAISGYNITLIIVFVSGLLKFLSKRWQTIIASLVILVFVVLVGGTAAVVRAAIMGVLGLWAVWFGRQAEVTRLLALTAALMTMWNPFILVDDVGFQLSFAATCGLIYMTGTIERMLKWLRVWRFIPEVFSIREAFVTTLAAQTLAVPIIVGVFGRFSLIAPAANVAAVSFIPLAMLFSFVAVLVSSVWFYGGLLVAYVGWFFLELIMHVAYWSARVPFSSIEF